MLLITSSTRMPASCCSSFKPKASNSCIFQLLKSHAVDVKTISVSIESNESQRGFCIPERNDAKNKAPVRIWTRMYPFTPGSRRLNPIAIALRTKVGISNLVYWCRHPYQDACQDGWDNWQTYKVAGRTNASQYKDKAAYVLRWVSVLSDRKKKTG